MNDGDAAEAETIPSQLRTVRRRVPYIPRRRPANQRAADGPAEAPLGISRGLSRWDATEQDTAEDDAPPQRAGLRSDRLGIVVISLLAALMAVLMRVLEQHPYVQTAGNGIGTSVFKRPRLLLGAGVLLGFAIVAAGARSWLTPERTKYPTRSAAASPSSSTTVSGLLGPASTDPLAVIAAYNAASIAAAASGDRTLMEPYLHPDSPVLGQIATEYARRKRRGERHHAHLVRWGIVDQEHGERTATVVTQEVWDDVVVVGGSVVDETRGSLVRVSYHLERRTATGPWHITKVTSEEMIP